MKNKPIYYKNGDIKFTIKTQNNHYHLEFYRPAVGDFANKTAKERRVRRAVKKEISYGVFKKLSATRENLQFIKLQLIPEILLTLDREPNQTTGKKEQTLDEYAQYFFELQKNEIKPQSLKKDINSYNRHIYPHFGKRLLVSIEKDDLKKWQNNLLLQTSPSTKKKYKRGYIQNLRSLLNKILISAMQDDLIEKNHFDTIQTPKKLRNLSEEQKERSVEPFTKEEIESILKHSHGFMRNFILLLLSTGLRPGEAIALEWSDVDFDREVINVTKTRKRGQDGTPKTINSIREVDMFSNAKNALKAQWELSAGKEKVFMNEKKGIPFNSHSHISFLFTKILNECEIEGKHLYALRHTFASIMIPIPLINMLDVSRWLGHKDLFTTLKIYAKFIKKDDEQRLIEKRRIDKEIDIF